MTESPKRGCSLPPEQQAIRDRCFHPSGNFVEFPIEDVETSIPARFEKIVRMYPDQLALKHGDRSLTFEALNLVVNRMASLLCARRSATPEAVALLFEDPLAMITAILATLKAGKCVVPLDLSYPKERNEFYLKDSSATLLLTDLEQELELSIENIDRIRVNIGLPVLEVPVVPACVVGPDAVASILYTSGSTGQPKGVVANHRSVLYDSWIYTNLLRLTPKDRLTLLHSFSFRAVELHLFSALLTGATLCIFDAKRQSGAELIRWLAAERITILHCIPTLFRNFARELSRLEAPQSLRVLHLSGAPVAKEDWRLYKEKFSPTCLFLHRMGTSETQTVSWCLLDQSFDYQGNNLPLGWPPPERETFLLDEQGNEVSTGQVGEIAVRSRYLSHGYLDRAGLTAEKYVANPDGSGAKIYRTGDLGRITPQFGLYHLGRKDFQLKIRGFRVELSEIEAQLAKHLGVSEVVANGHRDDDGSTRLIAYVVPHGSPPPSDELRRFLAARLPDYMIPSGFVFLNALPLTPNGKLNRAALPPPDGHRPVLNTPFTVPRNPVEEGLSRIWSDVLSLDRVGIHDNFFDLGGHSLAASRVITRVIQFFQLELPIKALFEAPTVAEMAVVVEQQQAKLATEERLNRMLSEVEAMTEEEAQNELAGDATRTSSKNRHD